MSQNKTTIELTSKPLKLWLALSGTAFLICFCGFVYSWGEPDMNSGHWFIATAISFGIYMFFRAARWWEHG